MAPFQPILTSDAYDETRAVTQLVRIDLPEWKHSVFAVNISPMDLVVGGSLPQPVTAAITQMINAEERSPGAAGKPGMETVKDARLAIHGVVCAAVILPPDDLIEANNAAANTYSKAVSAGKSEVEATAVAQEIIDAWVRTQQVDSLPRMFHHEDGKPEHEGQRPVTGLAWNDRVYIWNRLMETPTEVAKSPDTQSPPDLELVSPVHTDGGTA